MENNHIRTNFCDIHPAEMESESAPLESPLSPEERRELDLIERELKQGKFEKPLKRCFADAVSVLRSY
jgi:hypothetical protein